MELCDVEDTWNCQNGSMLGAVMVSELRPFQLYYNISKLFFFFLDNEMIQMNWCSLCVASAHWFCARTDISTVP